MFGKTSKPNVIHLRAENTIKTEELTLETSQNFWEFKVLKSDLLDFKPFIFSPSYQAMGCKMVTFLFKWFPVRCW